MDIKKYLHLVYTLCIFTTLIPHGFNGSTLIKQSNGNNYWSIDHLINLIEKGEKLYVKSYDKCTSQWVSKRAHAAAFSETNCFCHLSFDNETRPIECTPSQLFYRLPDQKWIAAYMLKKGDILLCAHDQMVKLANIALIEKKLKIYTIEVKKTHTFLVGEHQIVAHNMLVPLGASIGLTIPLNIGCGGASAGFLFGPIGLCGGAIIGGAIGFLINTCIKKRVAEYNVTFKPTVIASFIHANNNQLVKSVNDVLGEAEISEEKRFSKQFIKEGGYEEALGDFENLCPINVADLPNGKVGKMGILPDGRKVNVRLESSDNRPTLEIIPLEDKDKRIKIRYNQ